MEASTTPVESASVPSAVLAADAVAASSLPALSVEDESEVSESGVTSPWGAESFAASPLPLVLSPSPSFVVEPSLALWTPASSCWSCCSCSTTSAMAETGIVCMIITAEAMVTRAILAAKAAFRRVLRKQRRWASPSRRPPPVPLANSVSPSFRSACLNMMTPPSTFVPPRRCVAARSQGVASCKFSRELAALSFPSMPLFGCRCVYELFMLLAHQQNNHGKSMLQGNTSTAISTAPLGTIMPYLIGLYVLFKHRRN